MAADSEPNEAVYSNQPDEQVAPAQSAAEEAYGSDDIKVLEGLAAVRKRPAMYIGDTSAAGLHHLLYEVVDNSIDEAMAGFCSRIQVQIRADGVISVEDDGRGIPVTIHKTEKIPSVEVVLTKLHAGGKFDHKSYKVSGGLHGVGISVVNALSEWLELEIWRDGKVYQQSYARGLPSSEFTQVGTTSRRGTKVTFKPDATIFETTKFAADILSQRLRELAFLNPGLRIELKDETKEKSTEFKYDGGITDFIRHRPAIEID